MGDRVDIRIETTEELRAKFKAACAFEGMTYEEMLEELLQFRVDNEEAWNSRNEDDGVRRRSGGMKD